MKNFSTQYSECKKAKLTGKGKIQKFKDYPELMPLFPRKAVLAVKKALEENPNFGLRTIRCLRFGGQCYSGNPRCKALRAIPPFLKGKKVVVEHHNMLCREGGSCFGQTGGAEWSNDIAHALNTLQQIAESKEERVTE